MVFSLKFTESIHIVEWNLTFLFLAMLPKFHPSDDQKIAEICGFWPLSRIFNPFCKWYVYTGRVSSGQGKVREIPDLAKVREMSGNFVEGQGKSEYWEKSGKSQGICILCNLSSKDNQKSLNSLSLQSIQF